MPHLLRHGPSVYNGHLRGAVTLTPNAERLPVELSLPVFYDRLSRTGIEPRSAADAYVFAKQNQVPILVTYARHLLPLSSEGYLAFHTYCDTGIRL